MTSLRSHRDGTIDKDKIVVKVAESSGFVQTGTKYTYAATRYREPPASSSTEYLPKYVRGSIVPHKQPCSLGFI